VRKTLRPVYTRHPGWSEDISHVRRKFADLPKNAQRYTAAMVRSLGRGRLRRRGKLPADRLPNLRYLGVGPLNPRRSSRTCRPPPN
jgi:adenylosuccinate synthase